MAKIVERFILMQLWRSLCMHRNIMKHFNAFLVFADSIFEKNEGDENTNRLRRRSKVTD